MMSDSAIMPKTLTNSGMKHVIEVDGIGFDCDGESAEVISFRKGRRFAYIPETVSMEGRSFKVVSIGELAFSRSAVEKIVLPPSLRCICKEAFKDCRNLQTVAMPYANVDPSAFDGCRALDSVIIVEEGRLTGYLGRISRLGKASKDRICICSPYLPLAGSADDMPCCGLPKRSIYDYVDIGSTYRTHESLCTKEGAEQETADALVLMAVLSNPAEIDETIAMTAFLEGSLFSRAMVLACGIDGAFDTKGAREILEKGPNGRLYRKLSKDPFMVRLREVVKGRTDESLRESMKIWRSSTTLPEKTASLCAVRICLDRDMGLEQMLSAIAKCEGSRELEFAVYDRIVPVLGAVTGCASAGPDETIA